MPEGVPGAHGAHESAVSHSATVHVPVLLHEVVEGLAPQPDDVVLDATLGGAGHACALAARLSRRGVFIGLDADSGAVARARKALVGAAPRVFLVTANFRDVARVLRQAGIAAIDRALFDLGLSSDQLERSGRGFSFQKDEPLLMTFAAHPSPDAVTAEDILNEWEEAALADLFWVYGEERAARAIARAIVAARSARRITRTAELVHIITEVKGKRRYPSGIHPATKVFQALRIAVNRELTALQEGVASAWRALRPGGRIAVISFHSLEDRWVKRFFRAQAQEAQAHLITKKPIVPSADEMRRNSRARSAKLRILEKAVQNKNT